MRLRIAATGCVCFCLLLASCMLGPNYKRPDVQVPTQYRSSGQVAVPADQKSLADVAWADLFHDRTITNLVQTAIHQSFDLQAAAERVLEARSQYGIARSQLAPHLDASASFSAARTSTIGALDGIVPASTNFTASYTQAGLDLAWEVDLWGRLRRLDQAARAEYLAQADARHAVVASLVANVMATYLTLRELDLELEIAIKNEDTAQRGLKITRLRKERGIATGLDIRQAEGFLYTATSQIPATKRAIIETENTLSILLGQNPASIPRGKPLLDLAVPPQIPAGIPSALLERRPDIVEAEQTLIAANAQIGAAKALFFPQISLTGLLGLQSRQLTNLFTGNARQQDISLGTVLPIFNAGQLRNNLRLTEAQKQEMVANYRKVIQMALAEVSNALTDVHENRNQREQQELRVTALLDTARLAGLRYRGGLDSYLQVLDAERSAFSGEIALAQLRKNELLSLVELYRALGGGWQNI